MIVLGICDITDLTAVSGEVVSQLFSDFCKLLSILRKDFFCFVALTHLQDFMMNFVF